MLCTRGRFLGAAVLAAALAVCRPSAAADSDDSPKRLRTAAEIGAFLAFDWALLYMGPGPEADPPGNVRLVDKLTFKAWSYDASAFLTNFAAHPLAGTFYYTTARSNRSGPMESLAWGTLSALTWELIEFPENVSLNDLITTPIGGASLGEAMVQHSLWLDRQPTPLHRFLSGVLFPMKLLNGGPTPDAMDDGGLAGHVGVVSGGKLDGAPTLGLRFGSRLVHFPGYGEPGRGGQFGSAGKVSALGLDIRGGSGGLADLRGGASVALATFYRRSIDLDGTGWDALATGGIAYDFREHTWDRGPLDTWSMVHVPGLGVELRRLDGELRTSLRADVALTFGGARSFALDGTPGALPIDALTTTQRSWGYTIGWGFAASPSLEIAYGPCSLNVGAAIDTRYGLLTPDPWADRHPTASIFDAWSTVRAGASWKLPWYDLQITGSIERNLRRGSAEQHTRTAGETVVLGGIGFALR
ncbi:MAG: DUF3943 domain-containing protein [Myxococcales bacterium]